MFITFEIICKISITLFWIFDFLFLKDMTEPKSEKKSCYIPFKSFTVAEVIFVALMVALNIGFDILVSPAMIALTTHIVAGLLIMLPVNFVFIGLVKFSIPKFGSLTFYMTVFGTIASPLTFWGSTPGLWKIPLGLLIGLALDLIFLPKIDKRARIFVAGIIGAVMWWLLTFTSWQLLGLPSVKGFSSMLNAASPVFNGAIDFSGVVDLPILEFGLDFVWFSILCGFLSAGPVIIALFVSYKFFGTIEKTAVYKRFSNNSQD